MTAATLGTFLTQHIDKNRDRYESISSWCRRNNIGQPQLTRWMHDLIPMPMEHLPTMAKALGFAEGSAEYAELERLALRASAMVRETAREVIQRQDQRIAQLERLIVAIVGKGIKKGIKFPQDALDEVQAMIDRQGNGGSSES